MADEFRGFPRCVLKIRSDTLENEALDLASCGLVQLDCKWKHVTSL
jgi:hypothetical protein